jgi:hypothetical protein
MYPFSPSGIIVNHVIPDVMNYESNPPSNIDEDFSNEFGERNNPIIVVAI